MTSSNVTPINAAAKAEIAAALSEHVDSAERLDGVLRKHGWERSADVLHVTTDLLVERVTSGDRPA